MNPHFASGAFSIQCVAPGEQVVACMGANTANTIHSLSKNNVTQWHQTENTRDMRKRFFAYVTVYIFLQSVAFYQI